MAETGKAAETRPAATPWRAGPGGPLTLTRRDAVVLAVGAGSVLASAALTSGLGLGAGTVVAWAEAGHGAETAGLAALQDRLAALGTRALLVARGDRILCEWSRRSWRQPLRDPAAATHATASMAKAAVATTALLLGVGDGLVRLEDPVARYVPAWAGDPLKSRVTVAQVASHSSGLDDVARAEDAAAERPPEAAAWVEEFWRDPASRAQLALHAAPFRFEPGRTLWYSNPGFEVLAYVLAAALQESDRHPNDAETLLDERVMTPLGLPREVWSISYGGRSFGVDGRRVHELAGGAAFTPRALARVGRLMAAGGAWEGRQLLDRDALARGLRPTDAALPEDWRERRQPVAALGWWSNANRAWPSAPADTLVGAGAGHQLLVVIPSLDLVAVRFGRPLGRDRFGGDYWAAFEGEFLVPLVAAASAAARPTTSRRHLPHGSG